MIQEQSQAAFRLGLLIHLPICLPQWFPDFLYKIQKHGDVEPSGDLAACSPMVPLPDFATANELRPL